MQFLLMMKKKSNAQGPSRPRTSFRTRGAFLGLALLLLPASALLLSSPRASAQKIQERIVEGVITNKEDKPIAGAVVYLKDSKSLAMKTFITDEQGHYRFGQLNQNTDYEIWAEHNGDKSRSRNISSFDSRATFQFSFKVDKKK
ncbi:MAG: carboxypeptidase-like regulatory domain-containing protein [Acidobacteriota bacterium]